MSTHLVAGMLTAKVGPHTGSQSGLYVSDARDDMYVASELHAHTPGDGHFNPDMTAGRHRKSLTCM